MKEDFLHYLWLYQKFDNRKLRSEEGQDIQIIKTGTHNTNAGPDFLNARLLIGQIDWVGSVEIHLNSSDWNRHKHQHDPSYENVILHVVWKNDLIIKDSFGQAIPTLVLAGLIEDRLVHQYERLLLAKEQIPCQRLQSSVSTIVKFSMLETALMDRIQRKGIAITRICNRNISDWEETAYQILAQSFGFKLNNEPFQLLAQNLPFKLLKMYHDSPLQQEALFFGMAGFLRSDLDEHGQELKDEFEYLKKKHALDEGSLLFKQWKFMRTRPTNFPTVRLSQFLAIITKSNSLFDSLIELTTFNDLHNLFRSEPTLYWQNHYHFGKRTKQRMKGMGDSSIHNLLINTVVPLLVAYAKEIDDQQLIDKAIHFLEQIPAEKNHITRFWETQGFSIKTMFDSQGSIELYNEYCLKKRCLSCKIGAAILK